MDPAAELIAVLARPVPAGVGVRVRCIRGDSRDRSSERNSNSDRGELRRRFRNPLDKETDAGGEGEIS